MANTILTPAMITRESLRILHQKCNFIGSVNRQYDDRFARSGAKIGTSLDVRLPNKYVVRTGAALSSQNSVERKVTLPVATQKGVDVEFTSTELTMSIDDFSKRILEPAMAQLAASIEADAFNMYKDVPNYVGTVSTQIDYKKFQQAGQVLTENLAPLDNMRSFELNPVSRVEFSDAVKGLFQSSQNIEQQYREGMVGRTGGFNVMENTLIPTHTPGAHAGGTPLTNGSNQGTAGTGNAYAATTSLITDGWTGSNTLVKGDIITIGGVFDVHPESKVSTGRLKRFVVTADIADTGADMTVVISPAIIAGGAYQNASNLAADGQAITVLGTASTTYAQNLAYHRDAFIFATADLEMPQGVDMSAREVYDGISMRLVRAYDIRNDVFPCRFDVLYGYVTSYAELACRVVHQQV